MAGRKREQVVNVNFSLKDVGSEIIDQLSSDIYTNASSILREIVKNAYDAYLHIDVAEDDKPRIIIITRERVSAKKGVIRIADEAIGQHLNTLKANVQISISSKRQDLDSATGFRGLGSWATLGAGSKIVVQTQHIDSDEVYSLTIDVRRIYKKLAPDVTLDAILNDQKCIKFTKKTRTPRRNGTVVEIHCDGPPDKIRNYEFNRLWKYTNPSDKVATTELRKLVLDACPIPYANTERHTAVFDLYDKISYNPTAVELDGEQLQRRIPDELGDITVGDLDVKGTTVAKYWHVFDPARNRDISKYIDLEEHCISAPGFLVLRGNVPIGRPNEFAPQSNRSTKNWYIGEVHITADDIRPDAGGNNLRNGTSREAFLGALEQFYKKREKEAEIRSKRLSAEKTLRKAKAAAKRLADKKVKTDAERVKADNEALAAVQLLDKLSARGPAPLTDEALREAAKDREFKKLKTETLEALKEQGLYQKFSTKGKKTTASKKKTTAKKTKAKKRTSTRRKDATITISTAQLQAAFGRQVPALKRLGLDDNQVQEVLDLLSQVVDSLAE